MRLLSILLLASFLAGFAGGVPGTHAAAGQVVAVNQGSGDSGGRMAMDCPACPMMGACAASGSMLSEPPNTSWLQPSQPSAHFSDQTRAPDTAPPKRFSA